MSNFTLQDVAGSTAAVVVFAVALYVPGYVVGYATNLVDFRRLGFSWRTLWAIALSFAITPVASYLGGKFAGLTTDCVALELVACVWLVLVWKDRRRGGSPWREKAAICVAAAWIVVVIGSLVDIQVGHRLFFSVVEDDQTYRVAFTNAVLHTGVPPANPLFFGHHAQPMRYYYFWYVVCAAVSRIGHVTARQAFIASSAWAGLGLAAVLGLYMRYFLGSVKDVRRQTAIAIALLTVTGADLLPAIGSIFGQKALNGDMEWWSNDQISSWADSLLWVPHHVASLLCCLVAFLLLWIARRELGAGQRAGCVVVAAIALASGFGLSIYVAFAFAVMMAALVLRLMITGKRDAGSAMQIMAMGVVAALLLMPFLLELTGDPSGTGAGLHAATGHLFALSVRRMIDPGLLTGLPVVASWNLLHPVLLDQAARLMLLLPGLALELGVYGVVGWLYARNRSKYAADGPQRTALYLCGCGLLLALFVRSSVIGNNDFGYRAAMLPQFLLLVLAADLLASWRIEGREKTVAKTRRRSGLVYGLIVLGVAGTVYQVAMLRLFLPLEARHAESGFAELPAQAFEVREGFAELDRVSGSSAVVEFNPNDPHAVDRGDVVSPYTFYVRAMLMNANRQILSAEPQCAVQFGGDWETCAAIEGATLRLYALPAPDAQWAGEYCRQFGVDYLAVGEMDPVWGDAAGWAANLPTVASEPGFRVVDCAGGGRLR